MRRAARVDVNHLDICLTLRGMGASVLSLASVGRGCPDILVGWRGRTYLAEIKDGEKKWKLTTDQEQFHREWNAPIKILESTEQAVEWLNNLETDQG